MIFNMCCIIYNIILTVHRIATHSELYGSQWGYNSEDSISFCTPNLSVQVSQYECVSDIIYFFIYFSQLACAHSASS